MNISYFVNISTSGTTNSVLAGSLLMFMNIRIREHQLREHRADVHEHQFREHQVREHRNSVNIRLVLPQAPKRLPKGEGQAVQGRRTRSETDP